MNRKELSEVGIEHADICNVVDEICMNVTVDWGSDLQ